MFLLLAPPPLCGAIQALVLVAVILVPVIPPPLPQLAVSDRVAAIDGGGVGGGGCPYQVSAGRQKEEAASANMELDVT